MADELGADALWAAWSARTIAATEAAGPALVASAARLPDPTRIPPREWLYGTRLIRRFVSVLVAPGGAGKSALALAQAVALASGRSFLGERVHHSVPAWVINLEDPLEELERRLAAVLIQHGIPNAAVQDRLFLNSGRQRRLCMARQFGARQFGEDDAGATITHPDKDAVIEQARQRGIGLIVVDPFVKSHGLDENSNGHMDAAATAWSEIAEATGAAILLVHHVRKGGSADIESARGGKALTDAARSAAILSPMSEADAELLGVAKGERWRHVRLDDAKANMAPRAEGARWFRLETVSLGNASDAYPNGDNVAAIVRWRPRTVWSQMPAAECNRLLDLIDTGPDGPAGALYAPSRRGRSSERWAGQVAMDALGLSEAQAAIVIATWLRQGVLEQVNYRDEAQRKQRLGVRVVDALRPTATVSFSERNN